MKSMDDLVREVVTDFVTNNVLFTALDVSNTVKETMPFARHREVRDVVRDMFTSSIEPAGYARTPITVTLGNGSTAEALLYHSLVDSWDLDSKYDAQQRAAGTTKVAPVVTLPVTLTPPSAAAPVATGVLAATISIKPKATAPVAPVAPVVPATRVLWDQLFGSVPSLFPRK
jgi:hypothetical protein